MNWGFWNQYKRGHNFVEEEGGEIREKGEQV